MTFRQPASGAPNRIGALARKDQQQQSNSDFDVVGFRSVFDVGGFLAANGNEFTIPPAFSGLYLAYGWAQFADGAAHNDAMLVQGPGSVVSPRKAHGIDGRYCIAGPIVWLEGLVRLSWSHASTGAIPVDIAAAPADLSSGTVYGIQRLEVD